MLLPIEHDESSQLAVSACVRACARSLSLARQRQRFRNLFIMSSSFTVPFFLKSRTKPREFTRTAHACACTVARPPSARPPARSSSPAFHFAFRVVWCRGQSHGRGGSRIAVSSRARDSGATPCRSSRPSMPPVLASLSSPQGLLVVFRLSFN